MFELPRCLWIIDTTFVLPLLGGKQPIVISHHPLFVCNRKIVRPYRSNLWDHRPCCIWGSPILSSFATVWLEEPEGFFSRFLAVEFPPDVLFSLDYRLSNLLLNLFACSSVFFMKPSNMVLRLEYSYSRRSNLESVIEHTCSDTKLLCECVTYLVTHLWTRKEAGSSFLFLPMVANS
jgi:hypothetical protein